MIEVDALKKVFPIPQRDRKGMSETDCIDPRQRNDGFHALDGVSFRCEAGETLAILGANGAGKTTLLRILATVLSPDDGSVRIDGRALHSGDPALLGRIGMVSATSGLYRRLSGREMLEYFGQLYHMSAAQIRTRVSFLADRLDLHQFLDKVIEQLSTGMRQRLAFARALLHDPDIVILDEPTTGLDVPSARVVIDVVEQCCKQNKAVLISTHNMNEVERLCRRAVTLNHGQVVFSGSVRALAELAPSNRLEDAFMHLVGSPQPTTQQENRDDRYIVKERANCIS